MFNLFAFQTWDYLVPTGFMRTFYLFFVEFRWPRNRLDQENL